MAEAPTLPAQTPGMFMGGGGSGSALSGECAAAAADCGLGGVDFAPTESVTEVVRAAEDRCRSYDDARVLEERERSFDSESAEARADRADEASLRPSPRDRHLAQCVAAPILDPSFFRTAPTDPRTNVPGAVGYVPALAPAAPQRRGASMRTAMHTAFTTLIAPLVGRAPGSALTPTDLSAVRAHRIAEILRDAADEDRPRLRSTDLAYSTRPRQDESARREADQARPEPPSIASAAEPGAEGVDPGSAPEMDSSDHPVQRHAEGCVSAAASAQERAMQRRVRSDYGDEYAQTEREAAEHARSAERAHDTARAGARDAESRLGSAAFSATTGALIELAQEAASALVDLARANVDRDRANGALESLPALRVQSFELTDTGAGGALSGRVPESGRDRAFDPMHATLSSFDG